MNPYFEMDFDFLVEGLKGNKQIEVSNMSRKKVSYDLPEIHVERDFRQYEDGATPDTKRIPFGELYALNNSTGGRQLIWDNLKISDNQAREALELPLESDTPEVSYTREKVSQILRRGSESEILDMLEFGPYYIAEWTKEEAISIDSYTRRTFIGKVLGIQIDELQKNLEWASEDPDAVRLQYNSIKGAKVTGSSSARGRRTAAPATEAAAKPILEGRRNRRT